MLLLKKQRQIDHFQFGIALLFEEAVIGFQVLLLVAWSFLS